MITGLWVERGALHVRDGDVLHVLRTPSDKHKMPLATCSNLQALLLVWLGVRLA